MEDRLNKAEIVVTILLIVLFIAGVAVSIVNRVDKSSGELTIENYEKYLTVKCDNSGFTSIAGSTAFVKFTVEFSPKKNYKLTNVTVVYSLYSANSDFNGEYTVTFSAEYDKPYSVQREGKWIGDFGYGSMLPSILNIPSITIKVISITGMYSFSAGV